MKRAVAVSPHLDDAVFSCGATLAGLAAGGWHVTLVTVFTASVAHPIGFALRCQTDKGLAADVDYMALRRDEDRAAAEVLGLADVVHLPLAEAPHRGYDSAAALFAGVRPDDRAPAQIAAALGPVLDAAQPDRVLAPRGIGGHVDHLAVLSALRWLDHPAPVVRWRDTPYALREPVSPPLPDERGIPVGPLLARKLDACAAYVTQLGFQFGGEEAMRGALAAFADDEGRRLGAGGPAEALVEPARDTKKRRLGDDDDDDKAALVRALRAGAGLR
jgi:LmbE family N-acetylglucosaminyl deacetylase